MSGLIIGSILIGSWFLITVFVLFDPYNYYSNLKKTSPRKIVNKGINLIYYLVFSVLAVVLGIIAFFLYHLDVRIHIYKSLTGGWGALFFFISFLVVWISKQCNDSGDGESENHKIIRRSSSYFSCCDAYVVKNINNNPYKIKIMPKSQKYGIYCYKTIYFICSYHLEKEPRFANIDELERISEAYGRIRFARFMFYSWIILFVGYLANLMIIVVVKFFPNSFFWA